MFGIGTTELIIILVIVLIIFGAGKLPEIGGAFGKALKNFKGASEDGSPSGQPGPPGQGGQGGEGDQGPSPDSTKHKESDKES